MTENLVGDFGTVVAAVRKRLSEHDRPIVVAVDGGSGAGKSTIASHLQRQFDAALIPLDDFFSAGVPDHQWEAFTVEERLHRVLDWDRLRRDAIGPLLEGRMAAWRAFDFEFGLRSDGTYGMQDELTHRGPSDMILIEGAYSAGPALADVVDLTILVDVPAEERHARLDAREDENFLSI